MDIKHPEFEPSPVEEFELLDLRKFENCLIATRDVERQYQRLIRRGPCSVKLLRS